MMNKWNVPCDSTRTWWIQWDSSWPALAGAAEREKLLSYLENRFGIHPTVFEPYLFFTKNKGWWILKNNPHMAAISRMKVCQVGMRAFRRIGPYIKPTTRFAQVFGKLATKAVMALDSDSFYRIVHGEQMTVDLGMENGYIILMHDENPIGIELFIDGTVQAQLPKKEMHVLVTREFCDGRNS